MALISGVDPLVLYMGCLIMCIPLGLVLPKFKSMQSKHLFGGSVGVAILVFLFDWSALHCLFTSAVTYFVCKFYPQRAQKIVFLFAMTHLSLYHIYRAYVDYLGWGIDVSIVQMVLVQKLTAFAKSVDERYTKNVADNKHSEVIVPSPLEFFGYTHFYSLLLAGSFLEFEDYIVCLSDKDNHTQKGAFNWSIPIKRALFGVSLGVVNLIGSHYFPFEKVASREYMDEYSLVHKVLYLYVACVQTRCKYYAAWLISEAGAIANGFGFSGFDESGQPKWDRLSNLDVLGIEAGTEMKHLVNNWNKRTVYWLKICVFTPVKKQTGKTVLAVLLTYSTSAFWHGFYPGYYVFFFSMFFFGYAGTEFTRILNAFKLEGPVFNLLSWFSSMNALHYSAISFVMLDVYRPFLIYKSFYFLPHVIAVAIVVVAKVLESAGVLKTEKPERKAKKVEAELKKE